MSMSLSELDTKVKTIKNIRAEMVEAKSRMELWAPSPGCSNLTRANYHQAFKDMERLEKKLRKETDDFSKWLYNNDFNVFEYTKRDSPNWLIWIFISWIFGTIILHYL